MLYNLNEKSPLCLSIHWVKAYDNNTIHGHPKIADTNLAQYQYCLLK